MTNLQHRESKMQEKRKQTPWREFVKEICSWRPMTFYKIGTYVSRYPNTNRINKIIGHEEAIEQRDQLLNYGISYNKGESFFALMQKLFISISLQNTLLFSGCENSEYADQSLGAKNSYLSYSIISSENILYTVLSNLSTNVFNSISAVESENIYRSHNIIKSYNIFYSKHINNSSDLWFCSNMIGCSECLFSDNLENCTYYIKNNKYTKEDYMKKKHELLTEKNIFLSHFNNLDSKTTISNSEETSGKYITNSSNIHNGYYIESTHDSNNVIFVAGGEGCSLLHDTYAAAGLPGGYGYYGIMGCTGGDNVYNSVIIPRCSNTYYSYGMENCSYCLGCIGLVNKSFCILNKQYTKEDRYEKANEIFQQMDSDGTLGQFFPGSMNPFFFNDTAAYLIDDSFTKEEVEVQGYLRRDEEIRIDIPDWAAIVYSHEVKGQKSIYDFQGFDADGNRQIDPAILKKVIVDKKGDSYRIIKMEYDFLIKHGLPLPEIHWLDRIKLGFSFK